MNQTNVTTNETKEFFKGILVIGIPVIIQNLINSLVNMADVFMVGKLYLAKLSMELAIPYIILLTNTLVLNPKRAVVLKAPVYIVYLMVTADEIGKFFICFPRTIKYRWIRNLTQNN